VLVNPTTSTQTIGLGGTYSGSGMANVSSVTVAPQSGLVLLRRLLPKIPPLPPLLQLLGFG
jgi:hypothetical protein